MALSGLQIFKLLPKTNCKECGLPTCLAFAMKLASKAASIDDCPDASDEAKAALGAAVEPPMRAVKVGPEAAPVTLGGETVCYRHEKTFVNATAFGVGLWDSLSDEQLQQQAERIAAYEVQRVGERLAVEMVWLRANGGDFASAARTVGQAWAGPVVLDCDDPGALAAAAAELKGRRPVLLGATADTLDPLVATAMETNSALVLSAGSAGELAGLAERAAAAGHKDLLLNVEGAPAARVTEQHTVIRRAALRREVKALGYPILQRVTGEDADAAMLGLCRYASVLLLPELDEALLYPLMTLRQSIYTDPQKPIQVEPGIYPIGTPADDAPAFLTTNFSLTYFMVAGEIENAGVSANLVVHDCEGMSVLTAWAAGKFTGQKVAEFIKASDLPANEGSRLVIPGYAAMISGELEECLPGVKVLVGPQEAVDIPAYVKQLL